MYLRKTGERGDGHKRFAANKSSSYRAKRGQGRFSFICVGRMVIPHVCILLGMTPQEKKYRHSKNRRGNCWKCVYSQARRNGVKCIVEGSGLDGSPAASSRATWRNAGCFSADTVSWWV